MKALQSKPLGRKWKKRLDLSTRKIPEFYENADDVRSTPHAGAIRTTLQGTERIRGLLCSGRANHRDPFESRITTAKL